FELIRQGNLNFPYPAIQGSRGPVGLSDQLDLLVQLDRRDRNLDRVQVVNSRRDVNPLQRRGADRPGDVTGGFGGFRNRFDRDLISVGVAGLLADYYADADALVY